jgi:hypothetical protein
LPCAGMSPFVMAVFAFLRQNEVFRGEKPIRWRKYRSFSLKNSRLAGWISAFCG